MGTGQYDYQILQAVNNIYSVVRDILSVLQDIAANVLPILCVCVLFLGFFSLLNWVVKL